MTDDKRRKDTVGRKPCDEMGRDWSDAAAIQGTPKTDSHNYKLGRRKNSSYRFQRKQGLLILICDFQPPEL